MERTCVMLGPYYLTAGSVMKGNVDGQQRAFFPYESLFFSLLGHKIILYLTTVYQSKKLLCR